MRRELINIHISCQQHSPYSENERFSVTNSSLNLQLKFIGLQFVHARRIDTSD